MKIQVKKGNLFNVTKGHIVHGCNAQGVMGSGVALGVKKLYPDAYDAYMDTYRKTGLKLGAVIPATVAPGLVIWNAITQDNFGVGVRQVSYDAIEQSFRYINQVIPDFGNSVDAEIHIPLIGAARGGGNWEIIREIIEQTVTYPVTLWLPDDTVQETL